MIYLDHQATTPVDPSVLEAMLPYLSERFGNPASVQHAFGAEAGRAVDRARKRIADGLGGKPNEIVFCSGATEASNLAIKGVFATAAPSRRRIVTSAIEHPAVLDSLAAVASEGAEVVVLEVDSDGEVDLSDLVATVDERTALVSIGAANSEIGTLPDLAPIAAIAHERGALFHTDAAQAFGKVALDVDRLGIDLLSMSAHKLYGPKGVGALYVRRDRVGALAAQMHGGGHERGRRSGTVNVPGCVGFGVAAELARTGMTAEANRLSSFANTLLDELRTRAGAQLNGPDRRLPGNINLRFPGVQADAVIARCPSLAISAGSACSSATPTPSHVLLAIGLSDEEADESVRVGVGRFTTEAEISSAVDQIAEAAHLVQTTLAASEPSSPSVADGAAGVR